MITLMLISIILILLFFRYNPTIDEIKIRDTKLLVLWYNRDCKKITRSDFRWSTDLFGQHRQITESIGKPLKRLSTAFLEKEKKILPVPRRLWRIPLIFHLSLEKVNIWI